MITALCLFDCSQVRFQHGSFWKSSTIDPAKHLLTGVTSPVSAGGGGQLKRFDAGSVGQVRTGAQVGEIALLKKADGFAFAGMFFNQLYLIRIVLHQFQRLGRGQLEPLKRDALFDNFFHFCFDLFQILGSKGLFYIEIIVKPILDRGADSAFHPGEQVQHRLGHYMGGCMPESAFSLLIIKGQKLHLSILFNGGAQVANNAVYFCDANSFV